MRVFNPLKLGLRTLSFGGNLKVTSQRKLDSLALLKHLHRSLSDHLAHFLVKLSPSSSELSELVSPSSSELEELSSSLGGVKVYSL